MYKIKEIIIKHEKKIGKVIDPSYETYRKIFNGEEFEVEFKSGRRKIINYKHCSMVEVKYDRKFI